MIEFGAPATAPELLRAIAAIVDLTNSEVFVRLPGQNDVRDAEDGYLYLTGAEVDEEGDLILTARPAEEAIFNEEKSFQERTTGPDLVNKARNILWSAENGGYLGRPSAVRDMLTELTDSLEGK